MLGAINGGPADEGAGSKLKAQFRELVKRKAKCYTRFPRYLICRIGFTTIAALMVGTTFWDLGHNQRDLHRYVSVVAGSIIVGIVSALSAVIPVFDERALLYRETLSSMYSARVYGFVNVLSELPMLAVTTLIWCTAVFWMCHLPGESFNMFAVGFGFFSLFQSCFGQLVAALSPTLYVAEVVLPLISIVWMMFAGFLAPVSSFPSFLKPLYYVNPYSFFLRSMVSNVLHYRTSFYCDDSEIILIPPQYCPTLVVHDPHTDPNITVTQTAAPCEVCPFTSSHSLLDWYSWSYSTLAPDVTGLAVSSILVACLYIFFASRVRWSA
eukprot:TRINITY_DN3561_c3_g1_i1.p1 TRINITY_DN3561_c3_g1~~TRINITY_DN3561_c3_g1_i1.p1  ORF type:complete len:324 (+),score=29.65 TRINITY_DN3561_c3_g1_i1:822-1793(+)